MKISKSRRTFLITNTIIMVVLLLLFTIPYWIIISASITAESELARKGIMLWPSKFSGQAYKYLLTTDTYIWSSIKNSVFLAVVSTILSVVVCCMFAYPLSRSRFDGKKIFTVLLVFTMLFGGGLVPYYLTVKSYGLSDTLWSLILPGLVSAWNIILIRNYFQTLPNSLGESAQIDGANHWMILFRFYIPLSMPIIATVMLFCAVGAWNNWFGPMLFLSTRSKFPIQYMIKEMLSSLSSVSSGPGTGGSAFTPQISSRMAAIVIASAPIICVYPFLQKYFINGVILGSVKE